MKNILITIMLLVPVLLFSSPQGVPVETSVLVGTTPVEARPYNKDRGYLIIQNNGAGNCQVKFASPVTGSEGLNIGAGQNYEVDSGFLKSPVYMKCAASSSIGFLEANY